MHSIHPPGYYHNPFVGIPEFRHSIYGFFMVIPYFCLLEKKVEML